MRSRHSNTIVIILLLFILMAGACLRFYHLGGRPLHTDEAVHALKFGLLLEEHSYRYDPLDYHGPTLNYLTLLPAWLTSAKSLTDMDETLLRLVPAVISLLLILGLFPLKKYLEGRALLFAAALTAVSPVLVFYSRYYIQEMLLAAFSFGTIVCGFRYMLGGRKGWALGTGIFLGLTLATKETGLMVLAALLAAAVLTGVTGLPQGTMKDKKILPTLAVIIIPSLLLPLLFYSSFFSNPRGVLDYLLSYSHYLSRAGHPEAHLHPWWYYGKLLLWNKAHGTPLWSEAFVLILSGFGIPGLWRGEEKKSPSGMFYRFIFFYSAILTIIYSLLPYKTPWLLLGFYSGLVLLAGRGAARLIDWGSERWKEIIIAGLLLIGFLHLCRQSLLLNFRFEADPRNPWVYGHTSEDIFRLTGTLNEIAAALPGGQDIHLEVIAPGSDYWPLPWYLRTWSRVGWFNRVDFDQPAAPLIIVSPRCEADLIRKLYELPKPGSRRLYLPLVHNPVELRPGVFLEAYIRKDLYDRIRQETTLIL